MLDNVPVRARVQFLSSKIGIKTVELQAAFPVQADKFDVVQADKAYLRFSQPGRGCTVDDVRALDCIDPCPC